MFERGVMVAAGAALLAGVAAQAAPAAGEKVVLAPSPLEFPVRIGPLHLAGEPHHYDPAALGVSYQYAGRGLSLTVYAYDADVKDIPDGGDTVEACEQTEEAKDGVLQAKYPNTVLTREQLVRLVPTQDFPLAHEVRYELEREGRPSISYIWVTAVAKNFIKLRFSFDKQLKDEEADARQGILEALGEAMKPHLAPVKEVAKKEEGTSMNISMGPADDVATAMLYTATLAALVEKSPEVAPPCGGVVVPSFEVEVGALRGVMEMSAAGVKSKFGKSLAAIDQAGYLEEFVWTDMHREEWGTWEPANLTTADYLKWKKKHLKRLQIPNLGSLTISHPRQLPLEGAEPTAPAPTSAPTP